MEWKIGEIKQIKGEWYQCVEGDWCCRCDLYKPNFSASRCGYRLYCLASKRKDSKSVVFKRLEKVGKPFSYYFPSGRIMCFQKYKLFDKSYSHNTGYTMCDFNEDGFTNIEIKQTKENMEETALPKEDNPLTRVVYAYVNGKISDKELIRSIKEMSDEYPYNKNNLKPFSLELAKQGKPVCTRDGAKARIICFDAKSDAPIIALITTDDGTEIAFDYLSDGTFFNRENPDNDLMMLPEKKEGWVNVYKREIVYICENECNVYTGIAVYKSEGEAKRNIDKNKIYVNTMKITWEE